VFKSFRATSGFAAELPCLKDRTFEFSPDKINVLFGQNGCGKTTILKMLGAYTGLDHSQRRASGGGWSEPPRIVSFNDALAFPKAFEELTPGKATAEVDWDGVPAFYNSATLGDDLNMAFIIGDKADSPDGMMDGMEQLGLIMGHHSEGELRSLKFAKVFDMLRPEAKEPLPKPFVKPSERARDLEKSYASYVRALRGKKRKCQHTVLWDEPDRSLSIDLQIRVWMSLLPHLRTDKLQVIVATHSAIIPLLPQTEFFSKVFNFIDVQKDYIMESRSKLLSLMTLGEKKEE